MSFINVFVENAQVVEKLFLIVIIRFMELKYTFENKPKSFFNDDYIITLLAIMITF